MRPLSIEVENSTCDPFQSNSNVRVCTHIQAPTPFRSRSDSLLHMHSTRTQHTHSTRTLQHARFNTHAACPSFSTSCPSSAALHLPLEEAALGVGHHRQVAAVGGAEGGDAFGRPVGVVRVLRGGNVVVVHVPTEEKYTKNIISSREDDRRTFEEQNNANTSVSNKRSTKE